MDAFGSRPSVGTSFGDPAAANFGTLPSGLVSQIPAFAPAAMGRPAAGPTRNQTTLIVLCVLIALVVIGGVVVWWFQRYSVPGPYGAAVKRITDADRRADAEEWCRLHSAAKRPEVKKALGAVLDGVAKAASMPPRPPPKQPPAAADPVAPPQPSGAAPPADDPYFTPS